VRTVVAAALAGIALAVVWSCTVNTKTDKLACHTQADCGTTGRACENGYCVFDPGAKLDAAIDAKEIDAFVCPAACTGGCVDSTCNINGTGAAVTCPAGFDCTINCPTAGACGDITCSDARSCTITCGIEGACGNVTCGNADCTVGCTGTSSGSGITACGTVSCTAGACNLTCTNGGACGDLTCGTGKCTESCTGSGACGTTSCGQSCRCDVTCNQAAGECGTNTCPMHGAHTCKINGVCDSGEANVCVQTCP
jgi:hypothetical protein